MAVSGGGWRGVAGSLLPDAVPQGSTCFNGFMSDGATNASGFDVQSLIAERDQLKQHCERLAGILGNLGHPPGHYYSPLVDPHDTHVVRAVRDRLRVPAPSDMNLDVNSMRAMLRRLAAHHALFPSHRNSDGVHRYYSRIHSSDATTRAYISQCFWSSGPGAWWKLVAVSAPGFCLTRTVGSSEKARNYSDRSLAQLVDGTWRASPGEPAQLQSAGRTARII